MLFPVFQEAFSALLGETGRSVRRLLVELAQAVDGRAEVVPALEEDAHEDEYDVLDHAEVPGLGGLGHARECVQVLHIGTLP